MVYLWRAVDAEGEVLDVLVQSKRNKHAALKLMRKLLKRYAFAPERLVTDDLRSYGSAARELGLERRRERGRWKNNRAENSHQPTRRRERKMQRFKSAGRPMTFNGFVTFAHFTCQHRCALKGRTKENQSLGALDVGAKSTENGLFLASVTMPSKGSRS